MKFLLRIKFSGGRQLRASKSPTSCICKPLAAMQKVKDELTTSENRLRLANEKADDLTIKKLTHGNPTIKGKFDELNKQ
jgi:hypothetical protein